MKMKALNSNGHEKRHVWIIFLPLSSQFLELSSSPDHFHTKFKREREKAVTDAWKFRCAFEQMQMMLHVISPEIAVIFA